MTLKRSRFLTGITTSGTPHLGNYVGSIRPAVRASLAPGVESFYFLADYHALIKVEDPARVQRSTLEIAASWLACGLDPARVVFYRQSDIPEIPELTWLLTCATGKGLLNRAHAYKAAVDKAQAAGLDPDAEVNMGLFMYPVLMAADILMFQAHKVPVGRDQVQHIEMCRDMAASFNARYGAAHFTLPEAVIEDHVATLPGLDGRKMSKSYDNTIALFAPPEQLRRQIFGVLTDSRAPGQAKEVEGSALFQIYQAFASPPETQALRADYAAGLAWGEIKQKVFTRVDAEIAPLRARYTALMADPAQIEAILLAGAARARAVASPLMASLRHAVGLRPLQNTQQLTQTGRAKQAKIAFKQYREADGLFYFKLSDATGRVLLQSAGYAQPQAAAAAIAALRAQAQAAQAPEPLPLAPGVDWAQVQAALQSLASV